MNREDLKGFLDLKVQQYNQTAFIEADPIVIPHRFTLKQDREIAGFFAAILAWGQRKTIINKCLELMERMDQRPYDFILHHSETDLKGLLGFKHRTFNDTDLLYFIHFFRHHYQRYTSLESAFIPDKPGYTPGYVEGGEQRDILENSSPVCLAAAASMAMFEMEAALIHFRSYFFSLEDLPHRTRKHVSSPLQKSTCKRLNMFLRWMVRQDTNGVDFGIWNRIPPSSLICPCDVHVDRVGRRLGLILRPQTDWKTAMELTEQLRTFDPDDPVKYDFALFGLGIEDRKKGLV